MIKKILFLVFIFFVFKCNHTESNYFQEKLISKTVSDTIYKKIIKDDYRYMEDLEDSTVLNWYKKL